MESTTTPLTLEQQRAAFSRSRFLAMPLSGTICWAIAGIASPFLDPWEASMLLFIATGSIFYLAMGLSKFTGENFFPKDKNPFDRLFVAGLVQANLVWAIAIPFFIVEPRSLTLTLGILAGLMWMPFSWILQSRVGYFHAIARTLLIVFAWYVFPEQHFVVIPGIIVALYVFTIIVLEKRWRAQSRRPAR